MKNIVFHGTNASFSQFDEKFLGTTTEAICGGAGNKLGFYFTDDAEIAKKYSQEAGAEVGNEIVLVCEIEYDEYAVNDGYTSSEIENMTDEEIEELKKNNIDVELFIFRNPYYTEFCVMDSSKIKILGLLK